MDTTEHRVGSNFGLIRIGDMFGADQWERNTGVAMQSDQQKGEAETVSKEPKSGPEAIQRAVAGHYSLSIEEVLSEAWSLISGYKLKLNIAVLIYTVIAVVAGLIVGGLQVLTGENIAAMVLGELAYAFVTLPVAMGLFAISLDRASGGDVHNDRLFQFFPWAMRLLFTTVLMTLLLLIGYLLLILPGIYLSVAYLFAMPLLVREQMGIVQALEASRKSITHRWFTVFGLLVALAVINVVGAIPFGIGLIWTIPLSVIATGLAYQKIFIDNATTDAAA